MGQGPVGREGSAEFQYSADAHLNGLIWPDRRRQGAVQAQLQGIGPPPHLKRQLAVGRLGHHALPIATEAVHVPVPLRRKVELPVGRGARHRQEQLQAGGPPELIAALGAGAWAGRHQPLDAPPQLVEDRDLLAVAGQMAIEPRGGAADLPLLDGPGFELEADRFAGRPRAGLILPAIKPGIRGRIVHRRLSIRDRRLASCSSMLSVRRNCTKDRARFCSGYVVLK
jgi:hypothetical protein